MGTICICAMFTGCEKNNNGLVGSSLSTHVTLSFATEDGQDLLNPNTLGSMGDNDIDLYYKVGEEEVRQFHGNLDFPKHFRIGSDEEEKYYLTVFMNHDIPDGGTSVNILKYKNFEPDTIQATIHRHGYNVSYSDLVINGAPVSYEDLKGFVLVKRLIK